MKKLKIILSAIISACVVFLIVFTSCMCKSLSDTKKNVSNLEREITALAKQNDELENDVDELETTTGTLKTDVLSLKVKVAQLEAKIAELEDQAYLDHEEIERLKQQVEDINRLIAAG